MNTTVTDLFPVNSTIHDSAFKDFINNSIGYFLEMVEEETGNMKDGCFIDTAEGKYLDYWGTDLGIRRKDIESDDDYCIRLMISPLERFTIGALYELYDLQFLSKPSTTPSDLNLTLLSDNHFLSNEYYVDCSDEAWSEIGKKFIVGSTLVRYPL